MSIGILPQTSAGNNHAHNLLAAIYQNYFSSLMDSDPTVFIPVAWVDRQNKFKTAFFADIDTAVHKIGDLREQRLNTYIGDTPCREVGRKYRRPQRTKSAVASILGLHVDLDWPSAADERRLKKIDLRPSILIKTGTKYHYQGCYTFTTPVPKTHTAIVEAMNRQLCAELSGDQSATDLVHMLRAPGTWNVKKPENPQPVEIIEENGPYPFEQLFERLGKGLDDGLRNPSAEAVNRAVSGVPYVSLEQKPILDRLLAEGLMTPGTRHTSSLLLIRHFYSLGMNAPEVTDQVTRFFERQHNGLSKDWLQREKACRAEIKSQVKNWFGKAHTKPRKDIELSAADHRFIDALSPGKWERAFLEDAIKFILKYKNDDGRVFLSARTMYKKFNFRGVNEKNYRRRLESLETYRILSLEKKGNHKNREADTYRVVYQAQPLAAA